jgi:DNA-binding transcriptional MerR regulator
MANRNHHNPQSAIRNPQSDDVERRRARRLVRELGVNSSGVEVILRLRSRVVALQARVKQLEGELNAEQARSDARLARYRHEYYEAIWESTL